MLTVERDSLGAALSLGQATVGHTKPRQGRVGAGNPYREALNPNMPDYRTIKRRLARLNSKRESQLAELNGTKLWQGTREVVTAATGQSGMNAVTELVHRVSHAKQALNDLQATLAEYDRLLEVMVK